MTSRWRTIRRVSRVMLLTAMRVLASHTHARAACNIIPPAAQVYPSTLGSVTRPIATAGNDVEIRLTPGCDSPDAGFDPNDLDDVVHLRFLPDGAGQPAPIAVDASFIGDCTAGRCNILRFSMPDTSVSAPPYGFAGPAEITVVQGTRQVAEIGPLFQARDVGSTCDKQAETVFQQFTVLPRPNNFKAIVDDLAHAHVLATLDGSGSLLVPVDWLDELPLGSGAPIARLVNGALTVDAFPGISGPIHVTTEDVHSFTIDGKPLPPLIRVTNAGNSVFGTSDSDLSVIRIARVSADGQPNFDFSQRPELATRRPIVFTSANFSVGAEQSSVPLVDLKSSPLGSAYATNESTEPLDALGQPIYLNDDLDQTDQVVQVVDATTGITTNTRKAASPLSNPIVGPAAIATGGNLAAFIQGESQENPGTPPDPPAPGSDLNSNGQVTDDILRVYSFQGVEQTPDASRLASLFPAINRNPVAVDGSLTWYRTPDVRLGFATNMFFSSFNQGAVDGQHLKVTRDGRYFVATNPNNCGAVMLQHRDGASGMPSGRVAYFVDSPCTGGVSRLTGLGDVVISGDYAYAAAPNSNTIVGIQLHVLDGDSISIDPQASFATDGVPYSNPLTTSPPKTPTGLHGVTRLAITRGTSDHAHGFSTRVSLYALSPSAHALTVFDASVNPVLSATSLYMPPMVYSHTMLDNPSTCPPYTNPSPTLTCIGPMADARNLTVSPDGKFVYVAVHGTGVGSGIIKLFQRGTNTPDVTELADTYIEAAADVAVSPDGAQLYVISQAQGPYSCSPFSPPCYTLWTLNRDATTGAIGLVATSGIPVESNRLVVSPDGKSVHVIHGDPNTASSLNGLTTFARNTTGLLSYVQTINGGVNAIPPEVRLVGVSDAVMSPDSEHFYTHASYLSNGDGIGGRFSRTSVLHAFDATTQTDRPGVAAVTNYTAVAAGRAAWLSPGFGASNVNLYDAASGTTAVLNTVASQAVTSKLALSSQAVAYENAISANHLVVASTVPPYTAQQLVADAHDLGATDVCEGGANDGDPCTSNADCVDGACGAVVVFTEPSTILGDQLVIYRALDPSPFQLVTSINNVPTYGVLDFQVSGNIVAFRLDEMHFADWNGDGDNFDAVMFVYDLKSRRMFATSMASKTCQVAGCEPGLPYKIRDGAAYFTTYEAEQGCQPPATDCLANTDATVSPLGGGVDLNRDGQLGTVLQIFGDTDGDGVFDVQDDCRDTPNTDQLDTDADGLGDLCDPSPTCVPLAPGPHSIAPADAAVCQKAIGSASRKLLKAQLTAERKCLDRIVAGKLSGDPDVLCRGVPGGAPPTDQATADKIAKATLKLEKKLGVKCPDATLGQLGACGQTGSTLTVCLAARASAATFTLTSLLYGDVTSITDSAARSCQKTIGKAGTAELATEAKAMDVCLDKLNAGDLSGDPSVVCLGAWTSTGLQSPTDAKTARSFDKTAAKAARAIQARCPAPALAPLQGCGGGSAVGVADCIRCAAFSQAAGLVDDAY